MPKLETITVGVKACFCATCDHWDDKQTSSDSILGKCLFLSQSPDEYDDIEARGIVGWPVCPHDGFAVEFETRPDFGCIHYTAATGNRPADKASGDE